jgi:hypothetical protein
MIPNINPGPHTHAHSHAYAPTHTHTHTHTQMCIVHANVHTYIQAHMETKRGKGINKYKSTSLWLSFGGIVNVLELDRGGHCILL